MDLRETVMARHACLSLLGCLVCLAYPAWGQDGRLQKVRDNIRPVKESASPSTGKKDEKCRNSNAADEDDSILGSVLGDLVNEIFSGISEERNSEIARPRRFFRDYPYQTSFPGYMMGNPFDAPELKERWCNEGMPRGWSVRASVENGNDFDGVNRVGGTVLAETASRFGFLTQWHYFHENQGGGRRDDLTLGDINLTYLVITGQRVLFRVGLGARASFDHGRDDWGFNAHCGMDLFPRRPWVISTSLDAGTLGSAGVVHARGSVGYLWNRWEFLGGYDFLRVGDVNLQGPMLGVRVWF